ncbi:YesL family protein [Fundicoccus sp. Sow4_H7]|uniref:YesL family protein n=1 Tax=Fundicoccus sp. Sow4_H7 TaxID=3438784 RepID=UPI003F93A01B
MFSLEKLSSLNDLLVGFWKIIYLNILWILFTILGLGIFGIGPATYAISKYLSRWLIYKEEPAVFKSFFTYYKENFLQSMLTSWIIIFIFYVLIVNIFNLQIWYLQIINVLMLIAATVSFTHVFNSMVLLDGETIKDIFRYSMMMGFGYLHYTIILWTVILACYYLMSISYPLLILIVGVGLTALSIAYVAKKIIGDIQTEEQKINI